MAKSKNSEVPDWRPSDGAYRRREKRERAQGRQALPECHTNIEHFVSAAFFWAIVVVFVGWPLAQWILDL